MEKPGEYNDLHTRVPSFISLMLNVVFVIWYLHSIALMFLSGLPYDVTPEQALEHEEVRERINQSVVALQQATDKFLTAILKSPDKIP